MADVAWPADQNAPRGQFRLATVLDVNADKQGIIRNVRTFPSYPVSVAKPTQKENELVTEIPAKVLHKGSSPNPGHRETGVTSLGERTTRSSGRC